MGHHGGRGREGEQGRRLGKGKKVKKNHCHKPMAFLNAQILSSMVSCTVPTLAGWACTHHPGRNSFSLGNTLLLPSESDWLEILLAEAQGLAEASWKANRQLLPGTLGQSMMLNESFGKD